MDVVARIEFLRYFDLLGDEARHTCALSMLSPEDRELMGVDLDRLAALYVRTRAAGRLANDRPLTVTDMRGPHAATSPSDEDPSVTITPSRYRVVAGLDGIAVMIHLGVKRAWFTVVNEAGEDHDYSTWLASRGVSLDAAEITGVSPWPVTSRGVRTLGSDLSAERLHDLLAARDAHLDQYERRIDRIYDAIGGSTIVPLRRPFHRERPAIGWKTVLERRLAAVTAATRGWVRRAVEGLRWRMRVALKRLPLGTTRPAVPTRPAAAPVAKVEAPAASSVRPRTPKAPRSTEFETQGANGAQIFTRGQLAKRAAQVQEFARSGEVERLERLRGAHAGERCFIIGNGPSIKGQDLTLLQDEVTFVTNWFVNHPDFDRIQPNYYCISSHEVFGGWKHEDPSMNEGMRTALEAKCDATGPNFFFSFAFRDYIERAGVLPGADKNYLLFDRPKAQIDEKGAVNLNLAEHRDDGYTGITTFALPLARYMGFTQIYLLGCDSDYGITTPDSDKKYFYDFAAHTTRTTSHDGLVRAWAPDGPAFRSYEIVRDAFAADGIEIVNLTEGGRLEVFPRQRYEDVI